MFTISGATGRVGSATAKRLLADGAAVRVLVRDAEKGVAWAERGADVAVVDLTDRVGLTEALADSHGFFAMLPFNLGSTDLRAEARAQARSIAGAVADAEVPHVTALSSAGADLPVGTGPIVTLHDLEQQLAATSAVVSAIRSGHFQEKVSDVLDSARHTGVYPVFGSADTAKPMIATGDIGAVVAQTLLSPPPSSEAIDLDGPRYTERQVSDRLGSALGRELQVTTIPRHRWVEALIEAGFSQHIAVVLAELYDADERGLLRPRGDRMIRTNTDLETTLAGLLGVRAT